jgi:hypothetical protein
LLDLIAVVVAPVLGLTVVLAGTWSAALEALARAVDRLPGLRRLRRLVYTPVRGLVGALGSRVLRDSRDLPVLHVGVQLTLTVVPLFVTQLAIGRLRPWVYLAFVTVLLGPGLRQYMRLFACIHNEAHRARGFFKSPYDRILGRYFEEFLGQFGGSTPGNSHIGHVRLHHVEDAGPRDVQCIAHYDRSNLLHWLIFCARENLVNVLNLSVLAYFAATGRVEAARSLRRRMTLRWVLLGALFLFDWKIGLAYGVAPTLLFSAITGAATFVQHAFYDPADLSNVRASTTTLLHERDFLNEGLHLSHHLRCGIHWSALPSAYESSKDLFREHDSIVLAGLDERGVLALMFLRRFDVLARHVVDLRGGRTLQETAESLRRRVLPAARP